MSQLPEALEPQVTPIDIWDVSNQRSVINLVPGTLQLALENAKSARPELFNLDERTLWRKLRQKPTPTDNRLRLSFWMEYDRVMSGKREYMMMSHVYAGISTRSFFDVHYIEQPEKLAWMLTPPAAYKTIMEEALSFGIEKLREYLTLDPVLYDENGEPTGKINTKLMEIQGKIVEMLHSRVKGAVAQELHTKNLTLSVSEQGVNGATMDQLMQSAMDKIQKLQKLDRMAEPPAIEVLPDE